MQAKKDRRKRRRDANRQLKTWAEDAFGPQFSTKGLNGISSTTSKTTDDTSGDEVKMWRRLLKQTRSSAEAARVRRAWQLWQSTMQDAYEKSAAAAAFTRNEPHSSSTTHNENSKADGQDTAGASSNEWFAAWEAAFTSSSSASSTYSTFTNFNTDYESFWTYGNSDDAQRQAFQWHQKQREQARNSHPNYKQRFENQQFSAHRTSYILSKEVRSHLSRLGLATTHLPTIIELKSAFRTSALVFHPDRHPDPKAASTAEEKFKQVQAAFSFLKPMVVV